MAFVDRKIKTNLPQFLASMVDFVIPPACPVCLKLVGGNDGVCPPLEYTGNGAQLVRRMKYGDQSELVVLLEPLILRSVMPLFTSADLLMPVPMRRWRLPPRRFNQSAKLGRALSRLMGVPMQVQVLERQRATAQQVGLTHAARRSNLGGAFCAREAEKAGLAGRHILLVDDGLTTGATVEACTRTLLRAGAEAVDVVTLARVVMPETLAV